MSTSYDMKYRIGIIGLGSIGQRMLASISAHERFCVVSAWDPDVNARERTRANHPSVPIADASTGAIDHPDVDLVYVACPPRFHREYALAAMAAGKAILCEKPLGIDAGDSRDLVAQVEASGVPNAVNFLFGSARSSQTVIAAFENGDIGDLAWIELRLHLPRWAARRTGEAPWLARSAQGGFMREVGSHFIYLFQRLFDDVSVERVALRYTDDGAETFAHVQLAAGAVPITITGTTAGTGPEVNECIFWGSKVAYRIRDFHLLDIANDGDWVEAFPAPPHAERDTHLRQLTRLAQLLDGSHDLRSDLPRMRDALNVQLMVEGILASKPTGSDASHTGARS